MKPPPKTRLRVLRGHDIPPGGYERGVMMTLLRVFSRWNSASSALLKQHGLTIPHFEVLMSLNAGEGISQQDLTERLMLTKGNICVIVQKMEAEGLIERRTDPVDQRFHPIITIWAIGFSAASANRIRKHCTICSAGSIKDLTILKSERNIFLA
jgi:DNA-binding MarR family transcriptional regulator